MSDQGDLDASEFSSFVISLAGAAMIHMGAAPGDDGQIRVDLTMAQQTIDILAMLESKTKGNLTDEEEALLSGLLYESRMKFLEKNQGA